jgi:hypothetical protein
MAQGNGVVIGLRTVVYGKLIELGLSSIVELEAGGPSTTLDYGLGLTGDGNDVPRT